MRIVFCSSFQTWSVRFYVVYARTVAKCATVPKNWQFGSFNIEIAIGSIVVTVTAKLNIAVEAS